jgi:ubiquinone/menaquinone biosynthesis C-methylase UbiE
MHDGKTVVLPTRDGYDLWSEIYDADGNPLCLLEEPHVDRLLGDVRGLSILDVGCGTGRHAARLSTRGANVTGIDFSAGMLSKAREKSDAVRFIEHDLTKPLPFDDCSFARVICCLVVDHIEDLPAFFADLGRVCRKDGFIVVSVMHPALLLKGVQARFHDAVSGQEVRPDSYAHQISNYVMAALAAGLQLVELSEHAVDESLVGLTPRAAKYVGWPMLLLMKLQP